MKILRGKNIERGKHRDHKSIRQVSGAVGHIPAGIRCPHREVGNTTKSYSFRRTGGG